MYVFYVIYVCVDIKTSMHYSNHSLTKRIVIMLFGSFKRQNNITTIVG